MAQQLLGGSDEDETAWRDGDWYVARLCPSPLSHDERQTTIVDHERDSVRLQVRTPGDLQTLELAACDRVPPGPGQIEVAVTHSSINFADVLIAFGKFPIIDDREPQLGMDFVGVVTAVGEGWPTTRSVTVSAAFPKAAAGATSSRATPTSQSRFRPGWPMSRRSRLPPQTRPLGTGCTTWPGSRPVTKC